MQINEIESNQELQRVLWACYSCWKDQSLQLAKRSICYRWVLPDFEEKFGNKFHQSKLRQLSKLGFLRPGDTSRKGRRRYYKLVDSDRINAVLKECDLI